jgi:redox-sensitive transcriptional activator SoxR
MANELTISQVSRRSGVAASALRFYEEKGLIQSERAGSGHRRYPRAVLRRIAFIVFAQRVGMTLDEVAAELAKLPGGACQRDRTGRSCRPAGPVELMSALPSWSAYGRG